LAFGHRPRYGEVRSYVGYFNTTFGQVKCPRDHSRHF
jgi:hypothetical protein